SRVIHTPPVAGVGRMCPRRSDSHSRYPARLKSRRWWAAAFLLGSVALLGGDDRAHGQPNSLTKEEQEKVNAAIDKGVSFLRGVQNESGSWGTGTGPGSGKGWGVGMTAL